MMIFCFFDGGAQFPQPVISASLAKDCPPSGNRIVTRALEL
jgi:hypothetical protein